MDHGKKARPTKRTQFENTWVGLRQIWNRWIGLQCPTRLSKVAGEDRRTRADGKFLFVEPISRRRNGTPKGCCRHAGFFQLCS